MLEVYLDACDIGTALVLVPFVQNISEKLTIVG